LSVQHFYIKLQSYSAYKSFVNNYSIEKEPQLWIENALVQGNLKP